MKIPTTLLGGLSPEAFLQEYWQKKPLLVRGALPGFTSPLAPEELAGLACEEEVSARLILEQGGAYPWQLLHGPFDEADFADLPETHWTILVQEVDRHVPEVAAILEHFRFIPNWRLDDVMISYAPEGGNVGAHVDNYDVFLLQGLGHRRWQIRHEPLREEYLVPELDVRMLADFEPDAEWVLGPGDMLYLPPRIPHHGVALDDCMTYSIGFRAPSDEELVSAFLGHLLESVDPLARYADPDLRRQEAPGEITPEALARIRASILRLVGDERAIDRWFGRFMTEPKRGYYAPVPEDPYTPEELAALLREGIVLRRSAPQDFAFIREGDARATLFVGGRAYPLEGPLAAAAPLLSGTEPLTAAALAPHLPQEGFAALVTALVNEGFLQVEAAAG